VQLRRHDTEHATQYIATLRAWLQAQGDPVEAGQLLGVHENTIRYRLRKMRELTALDLEDGNKTRRHDDRTRRPPRRTRRRDRTVDSTAEITGTVETDEH
jgi:hypothetical protein